MPAGAAALRFGRVGGAIQSVFVAAQNAGSRARDQQKQGCNRRGLQAGEVVQDALAETLIPALGRQRIERFVEAQARAGDQIGSRLRDGMRIGDQLELEHLLALLAAGGAVRQVPLQLVGQFVRQLAVRCRDDPFVCKFAIHGVTSSKPQKNSY